MIRLDIAARFEKSRFFPVKLANNRKIISLHACAIPTTKLHQLWYMYYVRWIILFDNTNKLTIIKFEQNENIKTNQVLWKNEILPLNDFDYRRSVGQSPKFIPKESYNNFIATELRLSSAFFLRFGRLPTSSSNTYDFDSLLLKILPRRSCEDS